ncbi:four helix bundle protein [Candidatus Roizmanbacteria bacterium RIFCSPHIGHO2_01_FULL_39_12c]|uniref:Four helix bundle protein n=1 Tax=Candidatus Roizmanbacteria bacterium RIFCSPHIGHO2_01_FULL_39_12c TaxID=1802031 RepID=A0A1F7G9F2_9BACT|nr:MAG: four helix bundle protein [Candidatus Roizmanbacteria bacterium RIFCSPHIGHO2_01_FULL_39_12c]OGK47238.1 MAG: four helix bundle protein [Candidatus Roizmanbacteria bacterium RIFCSPLOWO2_01_FULL_40_13]
MENKFKIHSFTDLIAWQKAHQFVLIIYKIAYSFPKEETFGLSSQLKRAAISISSNIAEGFSRKTNKDKVHFFISL